MTVFAEYAKFYDALYKEKDYMSEAKDVDALLKRNGQEIKSLIVYGCGTGKHDVCFSQLGYSIHGIDMSEDMIKEAMKNSPDMEYEVADIRYYTPRRKYDAVLSLFHVMSYQNSNDDIKNAFSSARKALNLSGILLFDCWYGPGVLTDRPGDRVKSVEFDEFKLIREAKPIMHPNQNIVDVIYDITCIDQKKGEVKKINEVHNMRYFFCPEIKEYLSEAGFELVECVDCHNLTEPNFDSWTVYFVAKAV